MDQAGIAQIVEIVMKCINQSQNANVSPVSTPSFSSSSSIEKSPVTTQRLVPRFTSTPTSRYTCAEAGDYSDRVDLDAYFKAYTPERRGLLNTIMQATYRHPFTSMKDPNAFLVQKEVLEIHPFLLERRREVVRTISNTMKAREWNKQKRIRDKENENQTEETQVKRPRHEVLRERPLMMEENDAITGDSDFQVGVSHSTQNDETSIETANRMLEENDAVTGDTDFQVGACMPNKQREENVATVEDNDCQVEACVPNNLREENVATVEDNDCQVEACVPNNLREENVATVEDNDCQVEACVPNNLGICDTGTEGTNEDLCLCDEIELLVNEKVVAKGILLCLQAVSVPPDWVMNRHEYAEVRITEKMFGFDVEVDDDDITVWKKSAMRKVQAGVTTGKRKPRQRRRRILNEIDAELNNTTEDQVTEIMDEVMAEIDQSNTRESLEILLPLVEEEPNIRDMPLPEDEVCTSKNVQEAPDEDNFQHEEFQTGKWYAVAYSDNAYIGRLLTREDNEFKFEFLKGPEKNEFSWPRNADVQLVEEEFILKEVAVKMVKSGKRKSTERFIVENYCSVLYDFVQYKKRENLI